MFAYQECQSDILQVVNSQVSTFFPGGCEDFVNNAVTTLTNGANAINWLGIINAASGPGIVGSGKTGAPLVNSNGNANAAVTLFVNEHDALATLNAAAGLGFGQTGAPVQIIDALTAGQARDAFIAGNDALLELNIINGNQGQGLDQNGASVLIDNIAHATQAHTDFVNNNNVVFRLNEVAGTAQVLGVSGAAAVTDGPSTITARTTFVDNHDTVLTLNGVADANIGTTPGKIGYGNHIQASTAAAALVAFEANNNLAIAVNLLNTLNANTGIAGLKITDPSVAVPAFQPTSYPGTGIVAAQTTAQLKTLVFGVAPGYATDGVSTDFAPKTDSLGTILDLSFVSLACDPLQGTDHNNPLSVLCHVLCASGALFPSWTTGPAACDLA